MSDVAGVAIEDCSDTGMHHSKSITSVLDFEKSNNDASKEVIVLDDDVNPEAAKNVSPASPFLAKDDSLINVCSIGAGAKVLFATDEWFAVADNIIKDCPPIFDPDSYCKQGKVMDGWESRRRREEGHDWCIIKLSNTTNNIVGIEIDTAHFTGNQVPQISIEVAHMTSEQEMTMVSKLCTEIPLCLSRLLYNTGIQGTGCTPKEVDYANTVCREVTTTWKEILPISPLQPGYENTRMHYFNIDDNSSIRDIGGVTHVRVNYYPDGGVARLRLWSKESKAPSTPNGIPAYIPITTGKICTVIGHIKNEETGEEMNDMMPSRQEYKYSEISAAVNGGVGLMCSNKHYGEPKNLIQSNLGINMGDGWETARHPNRPAVLVKDPQTQLIDSPLMDWAILQLGSITTGIHRIIIDTKHFRGNYPESVHVEGSYYEDEDCSNFDPTKVEWFTLIQRCRMAPDSEHVFDQNLNQIQNTNKSVSHIRISIFPDGGISRLRVYGTTSK